MAMLTAIMALMGSVPLQSGADSAAKTESTAQAVEVLPQPRQVTLSGNGFTSASVRVIRVTDTVEDRFSARLLRDALRETLGVDCAIEPLDAPTSGTHELFLVVAGPTGPATAGTPTALSAALSVALPAALPAPPPAVATGKEKEGYGLLTDEHGARVTARSETGLFYGIQTLIQLTEQARRDQAGVPGLTISDWPEFGLRGVYIEGGQARSSVIVGRANLEQTIRRLARYKMNCLTIEIYNLAPFASFPWCVDANTLSRADWDALVELGRRLHVMIVPSLQSFGQISEVIWNCEQGKPYREATAPGLICPSRPDNIQFLQNLYKDLLTIFKTSPWLGVGCSEVGMQWGEKYCPLCSQRIASGEKLQDIYCAHVVHCADAVTSAARELGRDVRPMIWADEFYMYGGKRWAGMDKMPKRLVMGHWQYWDKYWVLDNRHYDGIDGLAERGFDVMFISASYLFNTYLLDLSPADPTDSKFALLLDSGVLNIIDQARYAQAYQAKGHPGQVLGGVCATFSQHDIRCWDTTWCAYALQADYTWGDPGRPWADRKDAFIHDFAASFYGARDAATARMIAAAYAELDAVKSDLERNHYLIRDMIGEYDIQDDTYLNNSLEQSCRLIRELTAKPPEPGKTVADVRARAEQAQRAAREWRQKLAALTGQVSNTQSLGYLILAAHKIQNHATRTLYLLDQEAVLAEVNQANPEREARLAQCEKIKALQIRLARLMEDTREIIAEMRELTWLGDDTASGYVGVMDMLEKLQHNLGDTLATLAPISQLPPPEVVAWG